MYHDSFEDEFSPKKYGAGAALEEMERSARGGEKENPIDYSKDNMYSKDGKENPLDYDKRKHEEEEESKKKAGGPSIEDELKEGKDGDKKYEKKGNDNNTVSEFDRQVRAGEMEQVLQEGKAAVGKMKPRDIKEDLKSVEALIEEFSREKREVINLDK